MFWPFVLNKILHVDFSVYLFLIFPKCRYHMILCYILLLLFDNNKIKMARKPRKKPKENQVWCNKEGKWWKEHIREGKTGAVVELNLQVFIYWRLALSYCDLSYCAFDLHFTYTSHVFYVCLFLFGFLFLFVCFCFVFYFCLFVPNVRNIPG